MAKRDSRDGWVGLGEGKISEEGKKPTPGETFRDLVGALLVLFGVIGLLVGAGMLWGSGGAIFVGAIESLIIGLLLSIRIMSK